MWLQLLAAIAAFLVFDRLSKLCTHYDYTCDRNPLNYGRSIYLYYRDLKMDKGAFGCGEIKNISYPFRLQESKSRGFELICQNNTSLLINLTLYYHDYLIPKSRYQRPPYLGIYQVKKISFEYLEIADLNFASNDSTNSFCRLPRYSTGGTLLHYLWGSEKVTTWVRCRKDDEQLNHSTYLHLPCADNNYSSFSSEWHIYLLLQYSMPVQQMDRSCQLIANMPTTYDPKEGEVFNLTAIWSHLQMGFPVDADNLCHFCDKEIGGGCPRFCDDISLRAVFDMLLATLIFLIWDTSYGIAVFAIVPRILGIFFLAVLLIHKLKRKYSPSDNVEQVLRACQNLMPRRYSYPEIKIITGHFREKLGQGGFGSVFKGCLFDHSPVAVKLLGKAKNGGQDFISEVATIGRIHHVNIVRLLGFCSEGRTRALLYEFMPNGSLDKYIFPGNGRSDLLSWDMLYKIALGVARGIEYLHGGCDMCILHFDIKPHNILLDENFCPKISDFGLAKLSPTQNTMTLSGYRGTIGYIAPEQVCRNFGGVSFKSDVYSFGMLLLQMTGRARNWEVVAPGSSQIYLPQWIYDRLSEGQEADIVGQATVTEVEIVKKLALVGLCCIQMKPANRPSMSQVIEMLEGRLDALQLPPKPFFMFPDHGMSHKEGSPQSICQSDEDEVSSLLGSKWPASSSYGDV